MIEPLTGESEWLAALSGLPLWNPPVKSILIVAPHPDDETLGAGGFIAAQRASGIDVVIVAVTDGENAYPKYPGLGKIRRFEQNRALIRLGVAPENIVRLQLPDSAVESCEQKLQESLEALITEDSHVVAPWHGDFHPDHQVCGRVAEEIANRRGATLTSYFFWTWHLGRPELLNNLNLRRFPLSNEILHKKEEALRQHRSQLVRDTGDAILPEYLLRPARRQFEVFSIL